MNRDDAARAVPDFLGGHTDPTVLPQPVIEATPTEMLGYVATAYLAGVQVGQLAAARSLEAPGSRLCDCENQDGPPANPATGAPMDHHCDCVAVEAAAQVLGSYDLTVHAGQCVHEPRGGIDSHA